MKTFKCSWKFYNVYEKNYYLTKKMKVLLVYDDIAGDMEAIKKWIPILKELFLRGKKLNILLFFISQSYFKLPKTID